MFILILFAASAHAQHLGGTWGTKEAEAEYYRIVDLPLPKDLPLEVGSFDILPDGRLAIGTRRGNIWLVDGAFDKRPRLRFSLFASGLDEVFGLGFRDGAFYVTQQSEVTRITDRNNDGRADRFETLGDVWGFEHYHEFSWGSRPDRNGDIWIVLGLSSSYHYRAKFRGWAFRITPEGKSIPIASGIRSAGGVAPNEHGEMFYVESQGPWNGSCSLKHLKPGGFMGHPISFEAYKFAPNLKKPIEPNNSSRMHIEAKRVKELVPYAVVFPYRRMGQSISGFRIDRSGGRFGPFENQIFVADYSLSIVMRATTEKVNGVWQGACYPFKEGFGTGLLAVQFSPNGQLVVGGTNRGWPVRGSRQYSLERLDWTGKTPFEIKRINIEPDGFRVAFTKPVDRKVASNPSTYKLTHFTHIYHKFYGSPEVDRGELKVTAADVSDDGLVVKLTTDKLVQGHVHEFDVSAIRDGDGKPPLHRDAYYTVNEIPKKSASSKSKKPRDIRVLTYNIHHGEGTDKKFDLPRIAGVIKRLKPDFVALQEVDNKTRRASGVDQATVLGKLTGMNSVFGKAMDYSGGQYGEAVLSRWPIKSVTNHALPFTKGREPRATLAIKVDVPNVGRICFAGTHLDRLRDETDRLAQAKQSDTVLATPKSPPTIFAGDFNALPDSKTMKSLYGNWRDTAVGKSVDGKTMKPLLTYPSHKPDRRIDYVLARPKNQWKVVESRVIDEKVASDHRPLLVVLRWAGRDQAQNN